MPIDRRILHPRDRRRRRERDRVVTSEDHGDRAAAGDAPDLLVDHPETAFGPAGHDRRVARVDDGDHLERLDLGLDRPGVAVPPVVRRAPDRLRAHPGARTRRDALVVGRSHDRDVRAGGSHRVFVERPRELVERAAEVCVVREIRPVVLVEFVGFRRVEGALRGSGRGGRSQTSRAVCHRGREAGRALRARPASMVLSLR